MSGKRSHKSTYLTTTIPQTREKGGNKLKGERRKGQKIREAGEKGGKKDGNVKFNCLFLYPPQSKEYSSNAPRAN